MEFFDRTIPTLIGFVSSRAKGTDRAVEHMARVIHVLKTISSLCTYLNEGQQVCSFYSKARNSSLNDDILWAETDTPTPENWDDVPENVYWQVFLRTILKNATDLHKAAIRIQFLAIKPMAACVRKHIKTCFWSNIAARGLLEHLEALTGPATNSSMKHIDREEYGDVAATTLDDVAKMTFSEYDICDATLMHLSHFAGPVKDLNETARLAFCETIKNIDDTTDQETAAVIEDCMRRAGDTGRRELLRCRYVKTRTDFIIDENIFLHAAYVLGSLRAFIEYESLL